MPRQKKQHPYAFTQCESCISNYNSLTKKDPPYQPYEWEYDALIYLNRKLAKCPHQGHPPLHKCIRKAYRLHCLACGELVGCPANVVRRDRVLCIQCDDEVEHDRIYDEHMAYEEQKHFERTGMDYPEWQIEQHQIAMERQDCIEMEYAKRARANITNAMNTFFS